MQRKQTFLIMMMALSVVSCGKTPVSQSSESTSNSNSESSSSSSSESLSSSSSEDVYEPRDVYASPKGTPNAKGTEDDPYNLTEAIKQSTPGHTLYLLEGTYVEYDPIKRIRAGELCATIPNSKSKKGLSNRISRSLLRHHPQS
jgi:hypothetical protein